MQYYFSKVPKHIGIIMDGNRRFAKKLMLKPWKGHEWGEKKLEKVLKWAEQFKIKELTLYTFSIQNFNRPKKEFNYLMKLFEKSFKKLNNEKKTNEKKIRINFIGRLYMFPLKIQKIMNEIMEKTKKNNKYILNFAMAYGGKEEIIDATIRIAEKIKKGELEIKDINEELFKKNLLLSSEPDLIIRTGGEKRLSNFLSFQSAYTEFIFLDKMWPEFEKKDFVYCLKEYNNRKRRFGK
ncbi:MAG: polyprenyl diphosphate synthase [Candidatus Woesearchaeota archaeon]